MSYNLPTSRRTKRDHARKGHECLVQGPAAIFFPSRGWQWKGQGTTTAEESLTATAALRHGVQLPGKLYGLHELRQHGHRVDLIGRERIEGTNYYALRITLDDGYTTTLYVDPQTWLVTRRRDVRPLHVDIHPIPTTIEQRMSDFRKVSGLMFSFANIGRSEDRQGIGDDRGSRDYCQSGDRRGELPEVATFLVEDSRLSWPCGETGFS